MHSAAHHDRSIPQPHVSFAPQTPFDEQGFLQQSERVAHKLHSQLALCHEDGAQNVGGEVAVAERKGAVATEQQAVRPLAELDCVSEQAGECAATEGLRVKSEAAGVRGETGVRRESGVSADVGVLLDQFETLRTDLARMRADQEARSLSQGESQGDTGERLVREGQVLVLHNSHAWTRDTARRDEFDSRLEQYEIQLAQLQAERLRYETRCLELEIELVRERESVQESLRVLMAEQQGLGEAQRQLVAERDALLQAQQLWEATREGALISQQEIEAEQERLRQEQQELAHRWEQFRQECAEWETQRERVAQEHDLWESERLLREVERGVAEEKFAHYLQDQEQVLARLREAFSLGKAQWQAESVREAEERRVQVAREREIWQAECDQEQSAWSNLREAQLLELQEARDAWERAQAEGALQQAAERETLRQEQAEWGEFRERRLTELERELQGLREEQARQLCRDRQAFDRELVQRRQECEEECKARLAETGAELARIEARERMLRDQAALLESRQSELEAEHIATLQEAQDLREALLCERNELRRQREHETARLQRERKSFQVEMQLAQDELVSLQYQKQTEWERQRREHELRLAEEWKTFEEQRHRLLEELQQERDVLENRLSLAELTIHQARAELRLTHRSSGAGL